MGRSNENERSQFLLLPPRSPCFALLCLEWLTGAVRVGRLVCRLFLMSRRTQCCLDHSDGQIDSRRFRFSVSNCRSSFVRARRFVVIVRSNGPQVVALSSITRLWRLYPIDDVVVDFATIILPFFFIVLSLVSSRSCTYVIIPHAKMNRPSLSSNFKKVFVVNLVTSTKLLSISSSFSPSSFHSTRFTSFYTRHHGPSRLSLSSIPMLTDRPPPLS